MGEIPPCSPGWAGRNETRHSNVITLADPVAASGQCLAYVMDAMARGRELCKRSSALAWSGCVDIHATSPRYTRWVIWCMSECVWWRCNGRGSACGIGRDAWAGRMHSFMGGWGSWRHCPLAMGDGGKAAGRQGGEAIAFGEEVARAVGRGYSGDEARPRR